jgi:hypothetical protein
LIKPPATRRIAFGYYHHKDMRVMALADEIQEPRST